MKSDSYLSRLQFFLSQLLLLPVFVLLPLILRDTSNDDININNIRALWEKNQLELPVPTHYAIYFTDNATIRIILLILFITIGCFVEFFLSNKKISGSYHSVCLVIFITTGALFLISCLLPFIPLLGAE